MDDTLVLWTVQDQARTMKNRRTDSDPHGHHEPRWGWVVTAAVFSSNVLCVGYYRVFGLFFVEIIDTFHSSTSLTSLIMGLQSAVLSLSALMVHNVLLPLVGERKSAVLGGSLMAIGMMITSFATSVHFLIFSLSFLVGLGNAMLYGTGFVLLGQYFERRRALAMAVANAGPSVGNMLLPVLATYLLRQYGMSGAWLLYGAVTLHLCVFASLYRPFDTALRLEGVGAQDDGHVARALMTDKGDNSELPVVDHSTENNEKAIHHSTEQNGKAIHEVSNTDIIYDIENNVLKTKQVFLEDVDSGCPFQHSHQARSFRLVRQYRAYLGDDDDCTAHSFHSAENVSTNKHAPHGALHGRRSSTLGDLRFPSSLLHSGTSGPLPRGLEDLALRKAAIQSSHPHLVVLTSSVPSLSHKVGKDAPAITSGQETEAGGEAEGEAGCCSKVKCDAALFRKPLFWLVQAYVCVGIVGATGAGVYLPALCQERGVDKEDTPVILAILGGLNLVGRVLTGALADRQWLRPPHIALLAFIVIGLLFNSLPLMPSSFASMVALAAVYGLFEGAYFTMLPLIIIDYVSLKHFSRTFGFVQLSQGACATLFYPLLGRLRDVTGNYQATFHCLGACALAASLLLLLETGVTTLRARRARKDSQ